MFNSDFTLSLGRVAAPADPKHTDCNIILLSRNPEFTGKTMEEETKKYEIDIGGIKKTIEYKNTVTVKAKWVALGSPNRMSAPALYGGETVLVLYNIKTNQYYYTTIFADMDLKRTDVMEWFFPARQKDKDPDQDDREGSYRFIIDTENKQVLFTTSTANEERLAFRVLLDTQKGQFLLQNTDGDFITLIAADEEEDTPAVLHMNLTGDEVHMITSGCYLQIGTDEVKTIGGNLITEIKGSTFTKFDGDVNIEIGGKSSITGKGDLDIGIKGKGNLSFKDDVILQSESKIGLTAFGDAVLFAGGAMTLVSPTVNIVSPAVSVSGALQAAAISVGGGSSASPEPLIVKAQNPDWETFDKGLETLGQKVTVPSEDGGVQDNEDKNGRSSGGGGDGSSSGGSDGGGEEEKQPDKVDGKTETKDSIIDMEGKIDFKSKDSMSFITEAGLTMKSTDKSSLTSSHITFKGDSGVNIEGGGVTLYDILDGILQILIKLDTSLLKPQPVTGTAGPVPVAGTTTPIHATVASDVGQLIADNTTFKGAQLFRSVMSRMISDEEIQDLQSKLNILRKE